MSDIPVPDIPGPEAQLCWAHDAVSLARCDRAKGHGGRHTWWMAAELKRLRDRTRQGGAGGEKT